jgi:hypothetical protein
MAYDEVCILAPLPDTTEVVNADRRVSPYWRVWLAAQLAAVNDLKCGVLNGRGTPEAVVSAPVGTLFRRLDGGAGTTLYVKESGTGATGWRADGAPVTPTFAAGDYTGSGGMTVTVAAGDVTTFDTWRDGAYLFVDLQLDTISITAPVGTTVSIAIPFGLTAVKAKQVPCLVFDNTTSVFDIGLARVAASGTTIDVFRPSFANFTASVNLTGIRVSMWMQVI